jgi:hypothetical protein
MKERLKELDIPQCVEVYQCNHNKLMSDYISLCLTTAINDILSNFYLGPIILVTKTRFALNARPNPENISWSFWRSDCIEMPVCEGHRRVTTRTHARTHKQMWMSHNVMTAQRSRNG